MKVLSEKDLKELAAKGKVDRKILKRPIPPDVEQLLMEAIARLSAVKPQSPAAVDMTETNALLAQLSKAVAAPKPEPVVASQFQPPGDYEFTIHRDQNGRIESVTAIAVQGS